MPKTREQIINSMCLTWDHSYGIMDPAKRRALFSDMAQVFDHEIAPLLGMQPTPAGKVRVRIAVAVAEDGKWGASGAFNDHGMENAMDMIDFADAAKYFVEADLTIPVVETVEGVVRS